MKKVINIGEIMSKKKSPFFCARVRGDSSGYTIQTSNFQKPPSIVPALFDTLNLCLKKSC